MKRYRRREDTTEQKEGPYGFVLTIRAIAEVAIRFPERPSMIRVFAVLAEYMNQNNECWVAQDTIAARLGVTRQAVNQQIKKLIEFDRIRLLEADKKKIKRGKEGRTLRYILPVEDLQERAEQNAVEERRAQKREAARKAREARQRSAGRVRNPDVAPRRSVKVQDSDLAPSPSSRFSENTAEVQDIELAQVQRSVLSPGATSESCIGCKPQQLHEETSSESDVREPQKRGPLPGPPSGSGPGAASEDRLPGVRVRHQKFGLGVVAEADGARLTVDFEKAGRKLVLSTFVEIVSAEPDQPLSGVEKLEGVYALGARVEHLELGAGTIVAIHGERITVKFDQYGERLGHASKVTLLSPPRTSSEVPL